jgi:hypothetical protein
MAGGHAAAYTRAWLEGAKRFTSEHGTDFYEKHFLSYKNTNVIK